ncbi:MAG TPA: isoprenylcysteine carboxylmethyltransferase family protein [Rubrobacteraceae bacterium]|nr:isoprenylcysteine carboxylmethyltransferase family protein [Rubrobacteraceae bacterium]
MAVLALALYALYLTLAVGGRMLLQLRRTGSTGLRGLGGRPGSAGWLSGLLFVFAFGLGLLAPVLDLAGALVPLFPPALFSGLALYLVGLSGTLTAQLMMGDSWRIGVDEREKTRLVTGGPFAVVRNPIFAAVIPTSLGLALLVPNLAALAGFAALFVALQMQVRLVEEPYLLRTHGDEYARYASRVGRFVPGIGRLRPPAASR